MNVLIQSTVICALYCRENGEEESGWDGGMEMWVESGDVDAQMKIRPNYARRLPKYPGGGATLIYCRVTGRMPQAQPRSPQKVAFARLLFGVRGLLARHPDPIRGQ